MLLEGASVRSAEEITGLHRDTILKLLVFAGEKCEKFMGRYIRNVPVQDVEVDEVWAFIGKKEKRVSRKTIRTLATAIRSSPSSGTRSWF